MNGGQNQKPEGHAKVTSEEETNRRSEDSSSGLFPKDARLKSGDLISERFRILRFIAQGGMGEVYEAEDLELGTRVALKTLRSDVARDEVAVERLKREIHFAREVTHRNVCRIFDFVHHRAELSSGGPTDIIGLTMELLHGETLAARIARGGRMSLSEALPLIRQMAAGLSAAHAVDVVHRDFKSANVMLEPDDSQESGYRAVITDFGLARSGPSSAQLEQLTEDNLVVGTADYMAPEQAKGKVVTTSVDVYAFGVVIFEMVTGARPHQGSTAVELLLKRVQEAPPSPREMVPDLDPKWDAVILGCLATSPEERFASPMAVVSALETSSARSGMTRVPQTVTLKHARQLSGSKSRSALLWLAGAAALIGAFFITQSLFRTSPQPATTHAPVAAQLTAWPGLEIDPSLSPTGGTVAFSANRSGTFEIYVLQLTPGSREIQLTNDGDGNFQPSWSPDGQRIAYHSSARGGIWVLPSLGGTPRRITEFGSHPAWSPDGEWLAFQSDETAELSANANHAMPPSTLWLVHSDGGTPRKLTEPGLPRGGHGAPHWSPDGERLVFATSDRRWSEIWSVSRDGDDLTPIVVDRLAAFDPYFGPTGGRLFFSAISEGERYGVWAINIDGKTSLPRGDAVNVANLGMASIRRFAVSPDGQTMVHTALATTSNLWTVALDRETAEPRGEPRPLTSGTGRNSRPSFSGNGALLAFDRWRVGVNQDIWLTRPDGSGMRQLATDPGTDTLASWLPDNQTVVYTASKNGLVSIVAATADGRATRTLTTLEPSCDSVRVSPDGQRIAYHRTDESGAINIWVADIDGSAGRQITFDAKLMGFPCWSPDGRLLAFERRLGDNDEVMVVEIEGGAPPRQITELGGRSWPYSWAPDGDRVAFAGLVGGHWNIYWVSQSSSEIRQLTDLARFDGYVRYPAWSPRGDQIVFERAQSDGDLWVIEGLK